MSKDIEPIIVGGKDSSVRFLHITVINKLGVLNRLTTLMRRKRYNIEEVSVSFDDEEHAHIIFAFDSSKMDITLAMNQIRKIHDVIGVSDVTSKQTKFFHVFYVWADDLKEFDDFPTEPVDTLNRDEKIVGMFRVNLEYRDSFIDFLHKRQYHYRRRIVTLL